MRGFTLLELLVAIAVLAVLTALAVPAGRALQGRALVAAESLQLLTLLRLARTRAVLAGTDAVLCPLRAGDDGPACAVARGEGWLAFSDHDGDRDFDAGDTVLRMAASAGPALDVTTRSGAPFTGRIVYRADGTVSTPTTLQLCVGPERPGRRLIISMTGRVRTTREGLTCRG